MGLTALAVATMCYALTSIDLARRRDYPMSLVFAAYGLANCGLIYASYRSEVLQWLRTIL